MSGVYIKGLEMPKTCKECMFSRYILGEWFCRTTTTLDDDGTELWESVGKNGNSQRADSCPLISVPDHGRLVDADALGIGENEQCIPTGIKNVSKVLKGAPTIIPADKEGEA